MKSVILEKGEEYYTYMDKVFEAICNEQIKYNWLITDCEYLPANCSIDNLFSKEYIWTSGQQLTEIVSKEEIQFIWGVFSGFSQDVSLEEVLKYDLPYANGYEGFWLDSVGIQHPLAEIEIVAWDSSSTLLISKQHNLVDKFCNYFPLSEDLSILNTKNKKR